MGGGYCGVCMCVSMCMYVNRVHTYIQMHIHTYTHCRDSQLRRKVSFAKAIVQRDAVPLATIPCSNANTDQLHQEHAVASPVSTATNGGPPVSTVTSAANPHKRSRVLSPAMTGTSAIYAYMIANLVSQLKHSVHE